MAKKKFLSPATRRRIQKMMAYVTTHAKMFDQDSYPHNVAGMDTETVCQTPFCAAGFAVLANEPKKFAEMSKTGVGGWRRAGTEALKLDPFNTDTETVFSSASAWPEEFREMYKKQYTLKTPKAQAKARLNAFCARWQNILDTDGADLQRS